MKYVVKITETLIKHVVVEAETTLEAVDKANEAYNDEQVVLDYRDYDGANFDCIREADDDDIKDYVEVEIE